MADENKWRQPKSGTKAFEKIKAIIDLGWVDIPNKKSFQGTGAPGRLLESLLGVSENNKDSPDLEDWEVKFHGGGTLITLFHKDPEPRGIIRNLVYVHGWPDAHDRISFRHTLSKESDRGFYVVNQDEKIQIHNRNNNSVVPFWRHNILLGAVGAKLRRLILVNGTLNKELRQVRFTGATAFWDFDLTGLLRAIETGIVCIDFDARTQGGIGTSLRNHGTKFRVSLDNLEVLYLHKVIIGQ